MPTAFPKKIPFPRFFPKVTFPLGDGRQPTRASADGMGATHHQRCRYRSIAAPCKRFYNLHHSGIPPAPTTRRSNTMIKFRYRFLIGGSILILMGCLLKLEGYSNYNNSIIPGIASMAIYFVLHFRDEKIRRREEHSRA
jgi:hypothetical protein